MDKVEAEADRFRRSKRDCCLNYRHVGSFKLYRPKSRWTMLPVSSCPTNANKFWNDIILWW